MRECSFEQLPHRLTQCCAILVVTFEDTLRLLTNAFHLLSLISAHERISAYSMYPISTTQLIDLGSLSVRITRLISYVASKCQVYQHSHTTTLERSVITLTHYSQSNAQVCGPDFTALAPWTGCLSVSVYLTHNLIVFRFQVAHNDVYNQTPTTSLINLQLCETEQTFRHHSYVTHKRNRFFTI